MPLTFDDIIEEAHGLLEAFNPPFGNFTHRFNILHATEALISYVRLYQWQSFEVLLMDPDGTDRAGLHRENFQALYNQASGFVRTELDGLAITAVRHNPRGKKFFASILVKAYDAQNTLNDEKVDTTKRLRFLGPDMISLYKEWKRLSQFDHWGMRLTVTTNDDQRTFFGAFDVLEPEAVLNQLDETDDEQEDDIQVQALPSLQEPDGNTD